METNWLAVTIGTLVYAAFCGMWHRQFAFGKKWEEAIGFQRPQKWKEPYMYYVIPLLSCFITTIAISVLLNCTNTTSGTEALVLGFLTGVGFAMAIVFTAAQIPVIKKPLMFGLITGTAQALGILIDTILVYYISR